MSVNCVARFTWAVCVCAILCGGCSPPPPPEPESSSEFTSEDSSVEESDSSPETESEAEESESPAADEAQSTTEEESPAHSDSEASTAAGENTGQEKSDASGQSSGTSGNGTGGNMPGSAGSAGTAGAKAEDLTAANAEEAARLAEEYLDRSEGESDVGKAYRDASIALHYARQFPGDARCLGLLDSARGRLQKLESQTESAALRSRGGTLPEKVIVEKP